MKNFYQRLNKKQVISVNFCQKKKDYLIYCKAFGYFV